MHDGGPDDPKERTGTKEDEDDYEEIFLLRPFFQRQNADDLRVNLPS